MLSIHQAGLAPDYVPYSTGLQLQEHYRSRIEQGADAATLVLLEHEGVYTAGRRTRSDERPQDGSPVVDVDRGGKITWHGPGQLVGYPVLRLREPQNVVGYVRALERFLIMSLQDHGIDGIQVPERSGVWVHTPVGVAKLAQIGVRVAKGITTHGFAVNCSNSLEPFARIVPCGISDAAVSTLSAVAGEQITPADLLPAVTKRAQDFYAEVAQ